MTVFFTYFCTKCFSCRYLAKKVAFRLEKDAATGVETRVEYTLDASDIDILCKEEVLGDELSLNFIRRTRWIGADTEDDLALTFRKKLEGMDN